MPLHDPDNDDRADWAQEALDLFARTTRMDTAGEEPETIIQDLITDLLHLADREGIDIDTLISNAKGTYEEEVMEERGHLSPDPDPDKGWSRTVPVVQPMPVKVFHVIESQVPRQEIKAFTGTTEPVLGTLHSVCRHCGQDIERWGGFWFDRGNNRQCVRHISGGEIVVPAEGQTHEP